MSLTNKLKFSSEKPLSIIRLPENLSGLFDCMQVKFGIAGKDLQQVLFFALNKKILEANYNKIITKLATGAIFWIAYPKKSSGIATDLLRDDGWSVVFNSDYNIVTSVSIDETWTGMRLKRKDPEVVYKRDVPMAERKTPGIDYVKRTVRLPKDAIAAMQSFEGIQDFFNSMSFTHKKEYVEAIVEAKKTETRQRRIEKMIEMLLKMKRDKDNKKKK